MTETARRLVHLFKYKQGVELTREIAQLMFPHIELLLLNHPIDLIVPVPLHPRRERRRGYNQASLLAKEISKHFNIPLDTRLCRRVVATQTQTHLTRSKRAKNTQGVFKAKRSPHIKGRHVLLIDDVITTGATTHNCAIALRKAGAKKVYPFAFIRAGNNPSPLLTLAKSQLSLPPHNPKSNLPPSEPALP